MTQKRWRDCDAGDSFKNWLRHLILVSGYATIFLLVVVFLPWFQVQDHSFHWNSLLGYYASAALLGATRLDAGGPRRPTAARCTASASSRTGCSRILLFLTALTGILLNVCRLLDQAMPTYVLYVVHLAIAVPMLVVEVPFGKWAHLLYRPLAIYVAAVKKSALEYSSATKEKHAWLTKTESRRRSCWTSSKKGPGRASSRKSRRPATSARCATTCWGSSSSPTRRRRATGSTAASSGVLGYGGGVIGRYCDLPEEFPEVAHFHTMRVNQPAGWFYTSDALRTLCDIWERHGSGLTNMHGSTGDIVFLGTKTDELEPIFAELTEAGFDLGGSGLGLRTPSLLRRSGALRVGLLRHHEALLRPHPDLPGRAAPAAVPLQVQDQVRRLPQRLRGLDRPRRPVRSSAPGRTTSSRTTRRWPNTPPAALDIQKDVVRPLPDPAA